MIFDFAIIGAGIAGASLAAELSSHAKVLLLEMEHNPGWHATGRSAAFWSETYGGPGVTPLTTASGIWLQAHGFLSGHGEMHIGRAEDEGVIEAFMARYAGRVELTREDPAALIPGLLPEWTLAIGEPTCADIDVAGVHGYYLWIARKNGAVLATKAELDHASHTSTGWVIRAGGVDYNAKVVANAAGAWADPVAERCGVRPLGVTPYRRTMVQLRMRAPLPPKMPVIFDINGSFYFKSEGGDRLWLSPHDEGESVPCDAAPEELDVAIAIDRLEHVVDWQIAAVERKWAGLRSFAPDRLPIYGFDARQPAFFWFAGQGGFGIQTAPAAAMVGAAVALGVTPDPMVAEIDASVYAPGRFG